MSFQDRYTIHNNLEEIGIGGQEKISNASVAIVGLGGLGCSIAQGLVSLGVGHITLIDNDIISISNLTRQILYQEQDIGLYKCEVATKRLRKHNSQITITPICERVTSVNTTTLLANHHIIMDGTDNVAARILIDSYCARFKIPFIYGGVQKFTGQVSVFNYLGRKSMQESFPMLKELTKEEKCSDSGVILPVVSIVGNIQVIQALNIILANKDILQGSLYTINLKNLIFRKFKLF